MLIDWFTVGAQALNFIILVWLLRRYLYQPILAAIAAREGRIAAELAAAAVQQNAAEQAGNDFKAERLGFDNERATLLEKALDEAKLECTRLLAVAGRQAADLLAAQRALLCSEITAVSDEFMQLAATEVFAITRKALYELASAELEERMAAVFIQRLRALSADAKLAFGAALSEAGGAAMVRSRFVLGERDRTAISQAMDAAFTATSHLAFETAPGSGAGIAMTVGGQRLSWGIAEYLNSLQARLVALAATPVASGS